MATDGPSLRPGENEITNQEEKLWRQVNPGWVHDGRVSSQLFRPTPKDTGEVSVTRSSLVTPEESHRHHTEVMGYASAGVYYVDVAEVQEVGLRVVDDSQVDDEDERPPAHAYVDFKSVQSKGDQQRRASKLRDKAEKHGWQYGPVAK
ncbi:hypothetical protein [Streptomyces sp. NBC_00582]|uniref:hypothetical protein n=1 Tax=Streptomyces sp. NBC_00582 TaxID=2975783 RepID=UPI001063691B|nr:hypothetical protein [Streptomyces sp. NBC_00582]WUB62934.1 hypothetical protein OG852_22250 [Streptomyces sp. NBC_00582]